LPEAALRVLHDAVLTACDSLDGVRDRLLTDPRRCTFDPVVVQCAPGKPAEGCLTAAQATAARAIYDGLRDPRTGRRISHGMSRGSEQNWVPEVDTVAPNVTYFRWLVFGDSTWDWRSFDFRQTRDMQAFRDSEARYAAVFDGTNPDLSAFARRGGKIVQWHGWNDHQIPAVNTIDYYDSVASRLARGRDHVAALQEVQGFYRLFLAPGGGHGLGQFGPEYLMSALERWVERGIAPDRIILPPAAAPATMARLLCPYPKVAVPVNNGDATDLANFTCAQSAAR
jgi:feruloyl esterase